MKIAVVGDVGIDFYKNLDVYKPGGIAFNVAYHLIQANNDVSLIGILGTDQSSSKLKILLNQLKINIKHLQRKVGEAPLQQILLKNGERKFVGYTPGVLNKWRLRKMDLPFIQSHDALFVPINDGMESIFNAVKKIRGPIKAADFSQDYNRADFDKKDNIITKNIKYFDVIFVGGMKKHQKMISNLSKKYPEKVIVLTLGKSGSKAFYKNRVYSQQAKKLTVVDATGAGDAFQATFLSTWILEQNIIQGMKNGTNQASLVIKHVGSTNLEIN